MPLPQDPFILFSVLNTKLRDEYSTLDDLCDDLQEDRGALERRLADAGFSYDNTLHKFI